MIRKSLLLAVLSIVVSALVSAVTVYLAAIRPRQRTWGVDPEEASKPLPGDDVIANPTVADTRGITIAAPPEQIWPWLLQMGYGRAGWYSYDRLDNEGHSVHKILPDYQHLELGDVVPTHPGGGFRVERLEPGRHLVLLVDPALMQAGTAQTTEGEAGTESAAVPRSLEASGRLTDLAMSEFRATWAFVLEPIDEAHTRLIERFRVESAATTGVQKVAMPILGLGVFAMTRKQMLGIRERVEETHTEGDPVPAAA